MSRVISRYQCPVCAFAQMDEAPRDHAICACCGTHFGYQDLTATHREVRDQWLAAGGYWFDVDDPAYPPYGLGWDAWDQLDRAGFAYSVTAPQANVGTVWFKPKMVKTVPYQRENRLSNPKLAYA